MPRSQSFEPAATTRPGQNSGVVSDVTTAETLTTAGERPIGSRVRGVDIARGLALIGMAAVHVYPLVTDDGEPTWAWSLFAGNAAALFGLLAGVSLAFMSGGRKPSTDGTVRMSVCAGLAARAGVIALLGLLLGLVVPEDPAIILSYYGLMFLLAVPVLYSPIRVLVFLAVSGALVSPVVMQALRPLLPAFDDMNPTLLTVFTQPWSTASALALTGIYPAIPWMTYLCTGIVLGRLDLRSTVVARRLFGWGLVLAVVPVLLSHLLLDVLGGYEQLQQTRGLGPDGVDDVVVWGPNPTLPTNTDWWLTIIAPHSSTPLDLVHTTGTSLAVLGAVLLLEARFALFRRLTTPVAAAGTMSLTLYSVNVLLTGFGVLADTPTVMWLAQVVLGLAFAWFWHRTMGQGPLERPVGRVHAAARQALLAAEGRRAPRS